MNSDEFVQKAVKIIDGVSVDSTTDSVELGEELLTGEMDFPEGMTLEQMQAKVKEMKAENEKLRQSLNAVGLGSSEPTTAEMYRPGTEKFVRRWPFDPMMPMELPFDQMDHETQFYTLSAAWSGRRADGHRALHAGDLDQAEKIFRECLDRADQMDVDVLRGLSHVCLSYVARQRGDQKAERQCLQNARDAYAAQQARN